MNKHYAILMNGKVIYKRITADEVINLCISFDGMGVYRTFFFNGENTPMSKLTPAQKEIVLENAIEDNEMFQTMMATAMDVRLVKHIDDRMVVVDSMGCFNSRYSKQDPGSTAPIFNLRRLLDGVTMVDEKHHFTEIKRFDEKFMDFPYAEPDAVPIQIGKNTVYKKVAKKPYYRTNRY